MSIILNCHEIINNGIDNQMNIFHTLRTSHPRLLAANQDFARIRRAQYLKGWRRKLRDRADALLAEPPARYEKLDGMCILPVSRRVLDRVLTLAMVYRLTAEPAYQARLWLELQMAANYPDWNPPHFLDTAELMHAFAVAYDWLFAAWSPAQRAILKTALVEQGLKPARLCYRGEENVPFDPWIKRTTNWNQVCNAGSALAALAIADEEPALAAEILAGALQSLPIAMAQFAPDGAFVEGPAYWGYATFYNVMLLAGLESALGTDLGLAQTPGFAATGAYPIQMTGPLDRTFNYADSGDASIPAPQLLWLANRFRQPDFTTYQRAHAQPHAYDLLWFRPAKPHRLARDAYFHKSETVALRGHNGLYLGFKAGDNQVAHSHLDLGSFVLDALGQRWAVDLGADNYSLPAYFGEHRWSYYRMRAEGHNTLVLKPGPEPGQFPTAATSINRFHSQTNRAFAIADLSAAYGQNVQRGIALLNRRQVLVQDEIRCQQPVDLWWFLHTSAKIEICADGTAARLRQGGAQLWARILTPPAARFEVLPATPLPGSPNPAGQAANEHVRKLTIHVPAIQDCRLAVLLVPGRKPAQWPEVRALAQW